MGARKPAAFALALCDDEAGGWDQCVAAAYDRGSNSYRLIDGNCGELPRAMATMATTGTTEIMETTGDNGRQRGQWR